MLKNGLLMSDPHVEMEPVSFIPKDKLTSNQSTKDGLIRFQDFPRAIFQMLKPVIFKIYVRVH